MSIDLKIMRPGKLAGLLNSTRLGEVTSEPKVRRNIIRAGLRVGDSTRVNVLAYAAWLVAAWHARRGPGASGEGLSGYDALRESAAARNRRLSASGRDIAPLPDVVNPRRRAACESDFRRFAETYFPAAFTLAWSGDHLKVIAKIEAAVLRGGQFAQAMPRGGGLDAGRLALSRGDAEEGQTETEARVLHLIGGEAMRKRHPGRPKGSKNATDVVVVERSHCPKCGSSRRSEYWGKVVNRCAGLRADGTPYTAIIRRRCRCLDCGQVRIDKEYA